jgi:hypothetical protein
VIVGRRDNHLVQAVPKVYDANVLPCEGITRRYDSFGVQQANILDGWQPQICFSPGADISLPFFRN